MSRLRARDRVKIHPSILKSEWFSALPEHHKERIRNLTKIAHTTVVENVRKNAHSVIVRTWNNNLISGDLQVPIGYVKIIPDDS